MTDEERNWRKAFEMIGPDTLRIQLGHRRNEFGDAYARCAERWLLEQQAAAELRETMRFETIKRWTVTAAIAGIVAAVAAVIAAVFTVWPTH
jgi:hypothetical protein